MPLEGGGERRGPRLNGKVHEFVSIFFEPFPKQNDQKMNKSDSENSLHETWAKIPDEPTFQDSSEYFCEKHPEWNFSEKC